MRQKLDDAVHLALVRLKTERQLAVTRDALWAELAEFSWVGLKPDGPREYLCGLYLRKKTKPSDGEK